MYETGLDIKVVDVESFQELQDGQEGEIWVQSSSVASGYFGQREKSLQVFDAELSDLENNLVYLRTGDLGYFESGNLFINGRLEDVIISGDRNFYPSEIEYVAFNAAPSDVEPRSVAAISKDDPARGKQLCILVFEIRRESEPKAAEVASRVWHAVSEECGLSPFRVAVFQKGTLPATAIDGIQYSLVREKLQTGQLVPIGEATAGKDGHMASSKDSKQLIDGAITEWKNKQVERQEQILQAICSEVRRMLLPSDNKEERYDMGDMSIFDTGLDFMQLETLRASISNIVGLAVPLGPGALLDNLTFQELSVRIERLRFPDDGSSENNEERGDTEVRSMEVKPANVKRARLRDKMREMFRLQKLMDLTPSRYEYCAELPTIPEKRLPLANVLIINVMGFCLAFLMILSSLYIAFSPVSWAKFTLRSDAAAIALIPVCYIMFIGALLVWLWFIRVSLLPVLPVTGRYPIYGELHTHLL